MVSIITPVFNAEAVLSECIESVLEQSFSQWELILLDDYSTDNSRSIIEKYASLDRRIKPYFFNENVGAGIARNKGINIADKRFIAFLDSDDYWHKDKLKEQINFMLENEIAFSYTRYFELNNEDKVSKIILSPKKTTYNSLLFNNYIKTLTAVYDTNYLGKIFMPDYRKRQDWGLWFNILDKTKVAYCLTKPLAFYRTSNASLSKKKILLLKENFNFYRLFLKRNIFVSFLMMLLFLTVHFYFKIFGHKSIS